MISTARRQKRFWIRLVWRWTDRSIDWMIDWLGNLPSLQHGINWQYFFKMYEFQSHQASLSGHIEFTSGSHLPKAPELRRHFGSLRHLRFGRNQPSLPWRPFDAAFRRIYQVIPCNLARQSSRWGLRPCRAWPGRWSKTNRPLPSVEGVSVIRGTPRNCRSHAVLAVNERKKRNVHISLYIDAKFPTISEIFLRLKNMEFQSKNCKNTLVLTDIH